MILSKEIGDIQKDIQDELDILSKTMHGNSNNDILAQKQLLDKLSFLKWVNEYWKLRFKGMPKVVKQKEIFFCQLGINIGSEQNGKRPVVVIQNNIGNSKGKTTLVVPITTYENSSFYTKDNVRYMSFNDSNGNIIERKLDFYEIEIQIEPSSKNKIHGIANVVHTREVSKIRLSKVPVAKVTDKTYDEIVAALIKNINKIQF